MKASVSFVNCLFKEKQKMNCRNFLLMFFLQEWIDGNSCFLLQNKVVDCPTICSCAGDVFRCSNESLLNVPPIPNPSCYIYLDNNKITTILPGAFKNLSTNCYTYMLDLDHNSINTFSEGAFDGIMNKSLELHLRYNNLTSIPMVFRVMTGLYELVLTGNPLKQFDNIVMVSIGHSLTYFEFDMGHFDSWPYQLRYLRRLEDLAIDHIPFKRVPDDAFRGLEHTLRKLEIYDSQLVKIPQAFCILENLNSLNLLSNQNLDKNNSVIIESCLVNRLSLRYLRFEENDLETFPSLFNMFQHISHLDVGNNGFTIMNFDLLFMNFTVNSLILDRNKFSRIPYTVNYLTSILVLNIAHNLITGIDEPDISKLVNLIGLDLTGNPLMYISHKSFQNNLNLQNLYLSETRLRTIPSAVMYLTNLYFLTLDQDPIDCTCDLSYLKPWNNTRVISHGSMCFLSNEKIQDYLTQFLPSC